MITPPENIIFFVEYRKSTKRVSGAKPASIEELRELISQKFSNLGDYSVQIQDADFQVMCDLEEIEQLYTGGKLLLVEEDSMQEEKAVVDDELVKKMQIQIDDLQKGNSELRNQVEVQQPVQQRETPDGYHVRIAGLPYDCEEDRIREFFSDLEIVEDGLWILPEYGSQAVRGEALITFQTEADQEAAIKKHGEKMGSRWIEVRDGSDGDFTRFQKILEGYQVLSYRTFQKRYMAKMRGFEWEHKEEDIEKFLDPIKPMKVFVIFTKRGSNSGTVYVELSDQKSLEETLGKKKEYLGDRWIDVWEADEMQFKLDLAQMCGSEIKDFVAGCRHLKMDGIPRESTDQDIAKFFRAVGVLPIRIHRKNTGEHAFVEFLSEGECKIALTKNNQHIRKRYISMKAVTASEVSRIVPQAVAPLGFSHSESSSRPRSSFRPERSEHTPTRYDPYEKRSYERPAVVPANATVKMSGLPFEATKNDIIKFWGSLTFIPESIKILEKNGKSTGTGRITFESVDEATTAIAEKQGQYIGDRYLHLSYWKQFR